VTGAVVVGRVSGLFRYPVKSLRGERLARARLDGDGVQGDREWAVENVETGRILSAKRYGELLMGLARTGAGGTTHLILPGGARHRGGSKACDAALSGWLGQPVRLARRTSGRQVVFDAVDVSGEEPESFEMETVAGQFMDSKSPVHILTEASLASMGPLIPEVDWDVDRFRPNILVETTAAGFPEDEWIDHTVMVGKVGIWVRREAKRCIVPTLAQPRLVEDRRILRTLIDERDNNLGVRAHPVEGGTIAVGDPVRLLPDLGPPPHLQHLARC
jgi:uncharacterized protein YcbX